MKSGHQWLMNNTLRIKMTNYIVSQSSLVYRFPRKGWPMAWVHPGYQFSDINSVSNWVQLRFWIKGKEKLVWIPAYAVEVVSQTQPPPTPPTYNNLLRLKFHSQNPAIANYGSFGIVPFSATAKWNKAHSVILNSAWVDFIYQLQTQDFYNENIANYPCNNSSINNQPGQQVYPDAAFRWLFEHENNAFFGAHIGKEYRIPAQGCFGGNLVTYGKHNNRTTEIIGLSGDPPRMEDVSGRPDLIHFCWCVAPDGRTINPKCKAAFIPVINPVGMKGVTNALNQQTEIWIKNIWI
jgi:hypothetical protein